MNKLKSKGFTLIELIIVIAIIALLAAIAIPKFMQLKENSARKTDLEVAKNLHTIVSSMVADNTIDIENLSDNPTTIVVDESKDSDLNTKKILETYYEQPKIKSKAMESIGNAYVVAVYKNGNIQIYMTDMNNVNIQSGDVGNRIYPDCNIANPDGDGKLF